MVYKVLILSKYPCFHQTILTNTVKQRANISCNNMLYESTSLFIVIVYGRRRRLCIALF